MSLNPGHRFGPYEIVEAAGAGGMGEVYKAKDTRLDRTVAIKVLPDRTSGNADLRARFEREAKAISSLNHPHICTLHDIGHENGTDFLVMEYIEGESLSEKIKNAPMDVDEALKIATQIADALDTAHRQGLIHRDLKPANVMLTKEGAKLLDFGLAKLQVSGGVVEGVSGATATTPLTGTGTIIGTLHYMSPEQLEGSEADARSDIFAFGALVYEMVTGQRAFDGKSQASLIASIMGQTPKPVSQVKPMAPPALDRLIKKCLEKDPDRRWQSARDMSDELKWIAQSGSQAGIPAPVSARRRLRFRLAWGLAGLMTLVALLLGWLYIQQVTVAPQVVRSEISPPPGGEFVGTGGGSVVISPDGSKVAFTAVDSVGERRQLFVRPLNATVALPLPGTGGASFPFWSPDSKHLAFFTDNKLKKILATGGPALTICDASDGRSGSWNADDVIIFTPSFEGVIHRVSAAGGEPQPLTVLDTAYKDFTHRWPQFLPDGDHFLFFARTGSSSGSEKDGICLSSLSDPTSISRLINTKSNVAYANGQILFMRDNVLMAQPFDAGSLELVDDAVPIAEQVSYLKNWSKGIFSLSNRGHLVFREGDIQQGSRLLIFDAEGNSLDTISDLEVLGAHTLSNNKDRVVAVIEDQSNSNDDLWIYEIARGVKTRFTFDPGSDLLAVWSPDDKLIAWRSGREAGRGIYIKRTDVADTAQLLVPVDGTVWPWQFTPDGRLLVYTSSDDKGREGIWLASVDRSDEPSLLLSGSTYDFWSPQVSPDGKWIAYASDESGKPQVYVSPFPNPTSKWQVSVEGGMFPRWSDDAGRLYFNGLQENILVAEVDGGGSVFRIGAIQPIFESSLETPFFDILDDGERFLVNYSPETKTVSRMILVQNWQEELAD